MASLLGTMGEAAYGAWKETVPMTVRLPLQTLFGDRDKSFTEDDFTREEIGEIEETIRYDQEQQGNKYERMIRGGQRRVDQTRDRRRMIETLTGALPVLMEAAKNDPEWGEYSHEMAEGPRKEELRASLIDRYTSSLPPEESTLFEPLLYVLVGEPPEKIEKEINYERSTYMPQEGGVASGQALQEQGEVGLANLPSQTRGSISSYAQYEDRDAFFGVNTALGKFNWEMKPSGERNITDTYDFYNEGRAVGVEAYKKMSPITRMLTVLGNELRSIPHWGLGSGFPGGQIGMAYIGDKGRDIDITYPISSPLGTMPE